MWRTSLLSSLDLKPCKSSLSNQSRTTVTSMMLRQQFKPSCQDKVSISRLSSSRKLILIVRIRIWSSPSSSFSGLRGMRTVMNIPPRSARRSIHHLTPTWGREKSQPKTSAPQFSAHRARLLKHLWPVALVMLAWKSYLATPIESSECTTLQLRTTTLTSNACSRCTEKVTTRRATRCLWRARAWSCTISAMWICGPSSVNCAACPSHSPEHWPDTSGRFTRMLQGAAQWPS